LLDRKETEGLPASGTLSTVQQRKTYLFYLSILGSRSYTRISLCELKLFQQILKFIFDETVTDLRFDKQGGFWLFGKSCFFGRLLMFTFLDLDGYGKGAFIPVSNVENLQSLSYFKL